MPEDIAPALLESIRQDFESNLGGRQRAVQLLEKIQAGGANYADAGDYAEEVGAALADAFRANLSSAALPGGRMYWNIADRVVRPLLEQDHTLVAEAAQTVQQSLNTAAGLGIRPQPVPLNESRVEGILNKISAAEQYDDVAWVLGEPVKNFSRAIIDESIRRNVEFQGGAGLRPRVIRRVVANCCRWCSNLAGTYTYPDVPNDVYRRHEYCRCTVEYDPGDGRRQNVHTKRWTTASERDKIETRKKIGIGSGVSLDNDKYVIQDEKISGYLLKPGAKHAAEFFGVGYSAEDWQLLNSDIYEQFDESRKTDVRILDDGTERFSIFMTLGKGKKKRFRTVWQKEPGEEKPRLITAYREDTNHEDI